ncbi:mobilization protein, partial [Streptomyces aculeolatus]
IETDYGLTRVNAGDGTAAKRATSAERHRADRQGKAITARDELRAIVRTAAAHAASEADFFTKLAGSHVLVRRRIAPSGDVIGLKIAVADNRNKDGEPVWFAGGTLAKDLTWPKIRERITAHDTAPDTPSRARAGRAGERWRHTTRAVRAAHISLHGDDPALGQAQLAAVGDLLDILPTVTTGPTRV